MRLRELYRDDYIMEASYQDLYYLTNHWKSDLLFYQDELSFLKNLNEQYFIWSIANDRLEQVQQLSSTIERKQTELRTLMGRIDMQLVHLDELIESTFASDEKVFRRQHASLEAKIYRFIHSIRKLKPAIFEVVKNGLDEEKIQTLRSLATEKE